MDNSDFISRKALREEVKTLFWSGSYKSTILQLIDNAPAIDIKDEIAGAYNEGYMCGNKEAEKERPQGKWIFQYRFLDEDLYKCSNCGGLISIYDNGALSDYKFCPNCGAKMKGDNK